MCFGDVIMLWLCEGFCLFVDGDEKEKSLLRLLKSLMNISLSIHVREKVEFLCV